MKEKFQAQKKMKGRTEKTSTIYIVNILDFFLEEKKEGGKGSSVDICKKLKVLIWSVTGMMP